MDCVFCKIVGGELPCYSVYNDMFAIAFLDIAPITKGHTLVLPRVHVKSLSELKKDEAAGLIFAVQRVSSGIMESVYPEGLNIFINQGEVAGQVVPHLHVHVVPRTTGDGLKFVTPRFEMSESDFKKLAKKITKAINV